MATMTPQWDGAPPTREDFDAHFRVVQWMDQQQHRLAVAEGRYQLCFIAGEPPWVETDHGREPLTDELAAALNININNSTQEQRT
jgi:hypothetical protein